MSDMMRKIFAEKVRKAELHRFVSISRDSNTRTSKSDLKTVETPIYVESIVVSSITLPFPQWRCLGHGDCWSCCSQLLELLLQLVVPSLGWKN